MTLKNDEIWEIIGRYFDRSMNNKDRALLEKWLEEDEENRKKLDFLEEIRNSGGDKRDELFFRKLDVDEDWSSIASHIRGKRLKKKQEKIHILLQKEKKQRSFTSLLKVAAVLLIAVSSGYLTLQFVSDSGIGEENNELAYLEEVSTNRGERANITLGDGTVVSLNVDSKLLIPPQFGDGQRRVVLEGEAFFDVKEDPDRPFLIEAGGSVTEVMGTSFSVRSYQSDNKVQVVVKSGIVALRKLDKEGEHTAAQSHPAVSFDQSTQRIILNGGEVGIYSKNDHSLYTGITEDPGDFFGWMQNRLIFRQAPLEEVMETLERWFDVTITSELSNSKMQEVRLTLNVKKSYIREVLDLVRVSTDIQYEIEDDRIVIK